MGGKTFLGAPFGTQCTRFDVSGMYPSRRKIGTFVEINHSKKLRNELERKLGPGKHDVDTGDFNSWVAEDHAKGPGWRRVQEVAQQAQSPVQGLCRDVLLARRLLKTKLGPGSYDVLDFTELQDRKPRSMRGMCDSKEQRFKDHTKKPAPGPGSYGKGGIPSALLDEKRRRPVSTCPTMDFSAGVERFPEHLVDSGLSPGTYNYKTFTELILNHRVSKRGPYDLFSGQREKPIISGYFAAPKKAHLNPGTFVEPLKVLSEDLKRPEKKHIGKFTNLAQYPRLPSERIYLESLSQCRRPKKHPGPGFYEPLPLPKVVNRNPPPFLSSSPRVINNTERLMQGNYTMVGVGRYNLANKRLPRSQRTGNAGHRYVFKSRVPRYLHDLEQDNSNQERLRPINIPPHHRVYYRPPDEAVKTTVSDSLN